jgi:hypothetical protein
LSVFYLYSVKVTKYFTDLFKYYVKKPSNLIFRISTNMEGAAQKMLEFHARTLDFEQKIHALMRQCKKGFKKDGDRPGKRSLMEWIKVRDVVTNANSKITKEIEKCIIEKQHSHTRHQDLSGSAQHAYIHWRRRSRRNSLTKVEYK